MDILFISHDAGRNGATLLLLTLHKWLKKFSRLDFETIFRNLGPVVKSFYEIPQEVTVAPVTSKHLKILEKISPRIFKTFYAENSAKWLDICKKKKYKVIYSNTATNGVIVESLRKPGVRVITHIHELDYWIAACGNVNWEMVKGHTDRFIACSVAVAENLACNHDVPYEKIEVIHEFIPTDSMQLDMEETKSIRSALDIPDNAFVVVSSGWEFQRKGKDLLAQLAKECRDIERGGSPFYFVWVGYSGDEENRFWVKYDAEKLGVRDRIKWTGETTEPQKLFATADAFAMISREDPFPLVCLEAGLCGKPIVCFADAGGIPEFVEKDAGFIVPYLDLRSMAACLLELRDNPPLTKSMGEVARAKVCSNYSVDVQAPKILEIIERELFFANDSAASSPILWKS